MDTDTRALDKKNAAEVGQRAEETIAQYGNATGTESDETLHINNCNQMNSKKLSRKARKTSRRDSVTKILRRYSESQASNSNTVPSVLKDKPVSHAQFDSAHGSHPHQILSLVSRVKRSCIEYRCTPQCTTHFILNLFPFVSILREYNLRTDLLRDLIAGVTVCVMHIPQGMAYGMLAGLAPVYGLYSSLFPVAIYFLFGTSRHISFGTMAVVSLMVSNAITRLLQASTLPEFITVFGGFVASDNSTNETSTINASVSKAAAATHTSCGSSTGAQLADGDSVVIDGRVISDSELRVEIAIAITLLVGVLQLGMSLLRLGFLTIYLSEPLISGFTTGSAVYVATSQVSSMLGYRVPNYSGPLNLIYTYVDIIKNIYKVNFVSLGIAAASIVILVVFKEKIQPLIDKKVKFPMPIDLTLIIITTIISYLTKLNSVGVAIVGKVPAGIPLPRVPDVRFFPSIVTDCLLIAIIGFATSISMAWILARKHSYEVHNNQEMLANGMSNAVSAFLNCHATTTSLSRSLVQDNAGCKSQVASLISCVGILLVLYFLAPLFEFIPLCVLAAIILVALQGMFMQFKQLPTLWKISKYEFTIWFVTFIATVLLGVDYGLICGFIYSVLTVMFRSQAPHTCELGRIRHTTLYKNLEVYSDIITLPGIRVIRFDGALYFASKDHLRAALAHRTGLNPSVVLRKRKQLKKHERQRVTTKSESDTESGRQHANANINNKYVYCNRIDYNPNLEAAAFAVDTNASTTMKVPETSAPSKSYGAGDKSCLKNKQHTHVTLGKDESADRTLLTHIVLDCTSITFIDTSGVRVISQIIDEYASIGVRVLLAGPHANVRELFEKMDFFAKYSRDIVLVTTHDAVLEALKEQKIQPESAVDFGQTLAGILRVSSSSSSSSELPGVSNTVNILDTT